MSDQNAVREPGKAEPTTTAVMVDLIRARYPSNTHITLFEVRDAAGFSATRSCDCLSLGTWPSRGLTLRGFEVKVSRADWLREFRAPEKAESFATFCDEWYLAVGDAKVVQGDELPETWGLLVRKGQRLECVKVAAKNTNPAPIDRGLLVALLKRAAEQGPTQGQIDLAFTNGVKQGKANAEKEFRKEGGDRVALFDKIADYERRIDAFERASGIRVSDFRFSDPKKLGESVRTVLAGGLVGLTYRTTSMLRDAREIVRAIEEFQNLPHITDPVSSDSALSARSQP